MWTQSEAIALCIEMERITPAYGAHVALTGGTLYKTGTRKDCDILLYRIRQAPAIDLDGMFVALAGIGLVKTGDFGWCHKAEYQGKSVDLFFREDDGEYVGFDSAAHEAEMIPFLEFD